MIHLETFEDWLRYQHLHGQPLPVEAESSLRAAYEHTKKAAEAHDVTAVVRRPPRSGEYRYGIAIEDDGQLWLTLWVKRSPNGEYFICYPRGRGTWNPHASYHRDGRYHQKSYGLKSSVQQRQALAVFKGTEHLGMFAGHGPGMAVCDPAGFTSVLRVSAGVLTGRSGCVLIDLVEPGHTPAAHHRAVPGLKIVTEKTYRDCSPWVVVAVAAQTAVA